MIWNDTKQISLADTHKVADTMYWRGRGMIGRRFNEFDGIVFHRCNNIHTCFMGIKLDVIFVSREFKVCALYYGLKPWRFIVKMGASSAIELPEGRINECRTEIGDQLVLK